MPPRACDERVAAAGRSAAEAAGVLVVFLQVGLVALVMIAGGLETAALRRVVACASGAFVVHHFLPHRLRLPFFALMSMAGIALVMGGVPGKALPDLTLALPRAAAIFAVGAGLIAVCHLPIGFWKRAALLLAAGTGLAMFRAGYVESGALSIVWPVLAGMFMFRVIFYLYEVSAAPAGGSISRSLSYFFLLPNSCALLFPVIDFRTFVKKHYDEPALAIYQRGAKWMTRGIVQLLLYHFVNLTLAVTATDVASGTDLIRYVITNTFHYVKISGVFHLLIGLLLLFGFNLPRTNRRYFLAASFTDYWRRVNIYWRDFMMRVFYYPAFFRLKNLGQTRALTIATLWTFFVTWALHQYQAWWVTGAAAVTWTDSLFWTLLAMLVLGSSLWELKRGRKRRLASGRFSVRDAAGLSLRTAATFATISVLWSLWSAPSIRHWLHIWSLADRHTLAWGAATLAVIMVATIVFEVLPALRQPAVESPSVEYARTAEFRRSALRGVVSLVALYAGVLGLQRLSPDDEVAAPVADARSVLSILRRQNPPGEARGYYEKLTDVDPGNRQFWETVQLRAFPFHYEGANPTRPIDAFPLQEPLPNVHLRAYDTDYRTNRWGMRNRDCELQPPPGTLRLAVLGSSHAMGWGVPLDATFASVLETRLNREHSQDGRFEILNFAAPGYGPLGQIAVVRDRVHPFRPQVVIHVAHLNDYDWVNRDAVKSLRARVASPDPSVDGVLRSARVTAQTNPLMATNRLRRHEPAMLLSAYREIVQACRAIDALPICVLMPLPRGEPTERALRDDLLNTAAEAGFETIDLSNVFAGIRSEALEIDEPGRHSNATAHAIVANALLQQLTSGSPIGVLARARQLVPRTDREAGPATPPDEPLSP